jgi:2-dehydro-3-deoxyphosphooctonate aldolase (KDO 8-P synthase)
MTAAKSIKVGNLEIGNDKPFVLIAGPCVLESKDHAYMMCESIKTVCEKLKIGFIYKSSFDKANRTSIKGVRGLGLEESLRIFDDVRRTFKVPMITDVHLPDQCAAVAEHVDVLQIPAFLCRQTDLLVAAAKTGKPINIKKGQFLAPWDMKNVANKVAESGNENIMLCERGVTFGYNTLVNDMRGLPQMAETGYPVVFDATHSVQQPGGKGASTGGDRAMVPYVARAAVATGVCAAVFMEVHNDPDKAPSDGPNMLFLDKLEETLKPMMEIDRIAKAV